MFDVARNVAFGYYLSLLIQMSMWPYTKHDYLQARLIQEQLAKE